MGIRLSPGASLLALASRPEYGLILVGLLWLLGGRMASRSLLMAGEPSEQAGYKVTVLVASGLILASVLALLQSHPRRRLGLIPPAATGAWLTTVIFILTGGKASNPQLAAVLLGFFGGLVSLLLLLDLLGNVPVERPKPGAWFTSMLLVLTLPLVVSFLNRFLRLEGWLLAQCSLILALWSWALFFPPAVELLCELVMVPLYRIRAHGPGRDAIPPRGPVILIANHSSYFDPFWVAKLVPRKIRPLMTSRFFDLPVVRWLMVSVIQAIRVQATVVRREVPELQEALAVLRQEGCLLIFPEGRLRRGVETLLQPFGQGVWHLLKELPETPVVVLWIEGGWGSFLSYYQGPPGLNKRLDWGRAIKVAFCLPRVLPAEVLADQRATRRFLERACLECRAYLKLPVPPPTGRVDGERQVSPVAPAAGPGIDPHQIDL